MGARIFADISTEPLRPDEAYCFAEAPGHGAVATFVGVVRDHNVGRAVLGVSYDVYDPLARNVLTDIAGESLSRWGPRLNAYVVHHKGRLSVGGISVVIAVGTPHRDDAFQACRYIIEELKQRAPIWKQEHYVDGDSVWVQGHALCGHGSRVHA